MPTRNEITSAGLRQLAEIRANGPVVISVYLNLDPEQFATAGARASEVRSLIDSGRRQIDSADLEHDHREQLRGDLERLEDYLSGGEAPPGAHGLAVFCSSSLDLFETLSLPEPVETSISFDVAPLIAPLAEIGPPGHWCVTLVNRRMARILRGSDSQMVQVAAIGDHAHGQHSQGGWSQARYQRSVENEVEAHLRHTAEVLLSQQRRRPFAGLLIAAPQELRSTFEEMLHSYVRERLVGYFDVDVERSTEDEVREHAAKLIAEHDKELLAKKLGRLRAELGRDGRAVGGVDGVQDALEQRRVETLLFTRGEQVPDDVIEEAIEAAIGQGAEVLPVDGPDLGPLGGIAALLRF
jgi:peptide subunit release factor 1 (eRF1)